MEKSFTVIIDANQPNKDYWQNIWRYRELFFFLAWRDIAVRYKQTWLGVIWVIIRPLLTMLVFTFVFSKLANLSSGDTPYPVMVLAGMIIWQLFSSTLTESGNSIISNASIISKVYFPRLIIPLSTILVTLFDFTIGLIMLVLLMLYYEQIPSWHIIALPFFILLAVVCAIGAGLWVAAINVQYRDFRFIVSFATQLGFYLSPIGFSLYVIPEKWRLLYSLNPMVGVIEGFRWSLLQNESAPFWPSIIMSISISTIFLLMGIIYFRKTEHSFVDKI